MLFLILTQQNTATISLKWYTTVKCTGTSLVCIININKCQNKNESVTSLIVKISVFFIEGKIYRFLVVGIL